MNLKDNPYRSVYIVPKDNYIDEVLISSLKCATTLDCMFGFFGSAALRAIAPGLSEYLAQSTQPMRLIASPNISVEDMTALREGVSTPREVIEARLKELLGEARLSTSALIKHTLACLAYMLATQRLVFRIACLRNGSLFHSKVWFFRDADSTVVAHGSSNFTRAGLWKNHEQISVNVSWGDGREQEAIDTLTNEFSALWDGSRDYAYTLDLPIAIKNELICEYKPKHPPTMEDFHRAWRKEMKEVEYEVKDSASTQNISVSELSIPSHLDLDSGPFSHQGGAISAWESAGRRGFLSMATGSGKTIAALAAATKLQHEVESLLIIISAPYRPLIAQWEEEVCQFGVMPLPISGSIAERTKHLDFAVRRLHAKVSKVEIMVVTEKYLIDENFRRILDQLPSNITALLIADEAHNLGKRSFLSNTPDRFNHRLGLSATPERQYDEEGTEALFKFFGQSVFEFSLKEAIGVCLVPYKYYIHQSHLSCDEYDEWKYLTEKLIRKGFRGNKDASEMGTLSEDVSRLLIKRHKIIESAENKVKILRHILKQRTRDEIKHVLVYTTDKNREQIRLVNDMLQNDLNLTIHQLTAEETANRKLSADILNRFAIGDYNAITCMRVLDEGVDIPQVSEAYILASSTVRRQWIQRRGRVLRKCDAIKKKFAHLHDFVVVPPDTRDKMGRKILESELERAREFAQLSSNGGESGGPMEEIGKLIRTMFT